MRVGVLPFGVCWCLQCAREHMFIFVLISLFSVRGMLCDPRSQVLSIGGSRPCLFILDSSFWANLG